MAQTQRWYDELEGSYASRVRECVKRLDWATALGDVSEEDNERIHELVAYESRGEGKANTTLQNRVQVLYKTAERGRPLTEHTQESLDDLLTTFKTGEHPDVKDSGIGVSNYQKALRVFYRYHDDLGIIPEEIDIEHSEGKDLRPEDLLYRDEVDAILSQSRDLRDRALFALFLATGQRNDAVRTLRMKHVSMDGRTMEIRINETEGATKGQSGTVPLLWAKHYVRDWVQHHPYKDDDEAALFPPAKGAVPEEKRHEPMKTDATTKCIKRMAERGGVEKERYGVTPHILRASAITRMAEKGVSEQRIKQIVGWGADSSQFSVYVALSDDLNNDELRKELGYPTSESEPPVVGRPTLETCPNTGCGDPIPEGRDVCPTCGFDLSAPSDTEAPEPDSPTRSETPFGTREEFTEYAGGFFSEMMKGFSEEAGIDLGIDGHELAEMAQRQMEQQIEQQLPPKRAVRVEKAEQAED